MVRKWPKLGHKRSKIWSVAIKMPMKPNEKCTKPINLAWTIDNAIGITKWDDQMLHRYGVFKCKKRIMSKSSCQYLRQLIKNMKPVAHTRWAPKKLIAQTDNSSTPKLE